MIDITPIPPTPEPPPPRRSQLVPGILLMLVGAWLLASNLGLELPFSLWNFVPVLFIAVGVVGLCVPNRHISRARGAWMLGVGIYLACGIFNLLGLSWGTAWPIFIIGAGLSVIFRRDHCSHRAARMT